jgi:hypothetical protein
MMATIRRRTMNGRLVRQAGTLSIRVLPLRIWRDTLVPIRISVWIVCCLPVNTRLLDKPESLGRPRPFLGSVKGTMPGVLELVVLDAPMAGRYAATT